MSIFALLHPARIIRRKAIWDGLFGTSRMWKAVAFAMLAREVIRKLSKAGAEVIDVAEFGAGRNMEIVTSRPLGRKEARRLKAEGRLMPLSDQRAEALVWASSLSDEAKKATRRRWRRSKSAAS